jgi:hypothetical protein
MPILTILITLIVVGFVLWLINLIPMQPTIKRIVNTIIIIVVVIWLMKVFGLWSYLSNIHV